MDKGCLAVTMKRFYSQACGWQLPVSHSLPGQAHAFWMASIPTGTWNLTSKCLLCLVIKVKSTCVQCQKGERKRGDMLFWPAQQQNKDKMFCFVGSVIMVYFTPVHANWIQPGIWHCGQVQMAALAYLCSFPSSEFCVSLTAMIDFHFPPASEDGRVVFLEELLLYMQFNLNLLLILRASCMVHLCSCTGAGGGD